MPRVSQDQLDARRREILAAARACFARLGYEGATVRRLEEATGLSRGAIFHHFRDKDSLFLAVAEDDAAAMVETVARNGLVQVMRDLLARAVSPDTTGWLGSQLEVSRRLRTDPAFARRWAERSAAIAEATQGTGWPASATPGCCAKTSPSTCWPSSWSWPTTAWCCTWPWADRPATWARCSTWSRRRSAATDRPYTRLPPVARLLHNGAAHPSGDRSSR